MQSHKDLKAWQEAMELTVELYEWLKDFPEFEKFALTSQMRRSAISVPSNIAEGCGRQSDKELIHFLYIALGSLAELETQIEIAERLKYNTGTQTLNERIKFIRILLSKLIKVIKNKQT